MKVAHIITGLSTGGAEMMLLKVLSGIDRSRFDSVVVSLRKRGAVVEKLETLGVKVYCLDIKRGRISPAGFIRLVMLLRKLKPDIIQGWMYHGNLAAQLSAFLLPRRIPVLWNIRGSHTDLSVEKSLTAFTIWLGARLSRLPVSIVNNSRSSALDHQRKLGYRSDRWVIIPNGFDTDFFFPSPDARARFRLELGLPGNAFLIGQVGRYHPVKDHDTFLVAASDLLKAHPEVHFVMVGDGMESSNTELMKKIKAARLADSTNLLGKRNDMSYLTAAFDIASSSSAAEGFPNVIGEAMACGVPCVVTDVGDSGYIVGNTGKVVPVRNPVAMADAWRGLIEMTREERLALGMAARHRVIENFSLGMVVRQYEHLYEEVHSSFKGGKS